MIISHICGGLGNQLAMWSFGRAYAEKVGQEHYVDIANYKEHGGDYVLHRYVLNRIKNPPKVIKPEDITTKVMLNEKRLKYNDAIWNTGIDDVYINIYAGDYRYSLPIIGKLREELNPAVELTGEYAELYEEMKDGETVSIHVRLQDYLRNPYCLILPMQYYRDALQLIYNSFKDLRVYLFTDEPEQIIKHRFNPGLPYTIISHGPERNLEDLSLMAACRHHIVANSSYSFWGAWLDGRGGGVTVVPDLYHKPDGRQITETYGEVIQPEYPPDWNIVKVRLSQ